jgi:hypothetical protein
MLISMIMELKGQAVYFVCLGIGVKMTTVHQMTEWNY